MDAARQVLRWSIPGAIFLLAIGSMQVVLELQWGAQIDTVLGVDKIPTIVIALAPVASIPIGFMLWVVYYVGFQPVRYKPFSSLFRTPVVSEDRGGRVIAKLIERPRSFEEISRRFGAHKWALYVERKSLPGNGGPVVDLAELDGGGPDFLGKYPALCYYLVEPPGDRHPYRKGEFAFEIHEMSGWLGKLLAPFHFLVLRCPEIISTGGEESTWWRRGASGVAKFRTRRSCRAVALRQYETFARKNWAFVQALTTDLKDGDPKGLVRAEFQESLDLYHALGVVRTSCFYCLIVSIAYTLLAHSRELRHDLLGSIVAYGVFAGVLATLCLFAHWNRRDALTSLERYLHYALMNALATGDRQGVLARGAQRRESERRSRERRVGERRALNAPLVDVDRRRGERRKGDRRRSDRRRSDRRQGVLSERATTAVGEPSRPESRVV